MLSKVKPHTETYVAKLVKPLSFLDPNLITIMGLIFPIIFFYAMLEARYLLAFLSIIFSSFDMLDGAIARSTGKVTKFGGVLDSSLDRISDGIYIAAFGFAEITEWWLVISLLITSYMISYLRSRAELAGKDEFKLDVGILERPERIIILSTATFLLYLNRLQLVFPLLLLLLFFSLITVLQRFAKAKELLDK